MVIDVNSCNKKYGIIYTDPPWRQSKGGKKLARPNSSGGGLDYPTLELAEIIDIHRDIFSRFTEKKHNVFMWTIDKYLIDTEQFMSDLGYTRHARIIWDKNTGQATAFTIRFTHEYLLWFYKKGDILMPTKDTRGKYPDIIRETVKKHSQKPEAAYLMLEDMFKGVNKLELFARNERSGWDCWGNEV